MGSSSQDMDLDIEYPDVFEGEGDDLKIKPSKYYHSPSAFASKLVILLFFYVPS